VKKINDDDDDDDDKTYALRCQAMTTEVLILTSALLFISGSSCSPVAEATSTLDRSRMSVYPPSPQQPWPRRYIYGSVLREPYMMDYAAADELAEQVKRSGNGAWIWMPAQGYVSVSKNQQAAGGDVSGKHGRIMRYGK